MAKEISTQQHQKTSLNSCESTNSLSKNTVIEIIGRLNVIYLGRLTSLISNRQQFRLLVDEWFLCLSDATPEDIARGMQAVRLGGAGEHPPSAPVFRQLCEIERFKRYREAWALPVTPRTGPYMPDSPYMQGIRSAREEKQRLRLIDAGLDDRKAAMLEQLEQRDNGTMIRVESQEGEA